MGDKLHIVTPEKYEQIKNLKSQGFTIDKISSFTGFSRSTIYNYLSLSKPNSPIKVPRSGRRLSP